MQNVFGKLKYTLFLILILFFNSRYLYANIQCSSFLDEEYVIYEHLNKDTYDKVEIFRRNNKIGPQQYGSISFEKWYELTFEFNEMNVYNLPTMSVVGLTKDGRLYHVVKFEEHGKHTVDQKYRTIARLLSGEHKFKSFQVTNKGRIMAWDDKEQSYFYSARLWNTSPLKSLKKRWLKLWGLTSIGTIVATHAFIGQVPFPVEFFGFVFNFPMVELIYSAAAGMSSGFAMLSSYENLNTYPNGFVPLGYAAEKYFWVLDQELKEYIDSNLNDFDPPELLQLSPKLAEELTEAIRN